MKLNIVTALLASSALIPTATYAQTNRSENVSNDDSNVIIVSARKRDESLQDVPVAITALTSDTLKAARIENLEDVAKLTPGLGFTPLFGKQNQLPIIRGASQSFGGLNVGVFLDGVYLSGKAAVDLELNDLARVEVVKGPQSALYGRNTFAGAINYVTKRPSADFGGTIEVTGGDNGLFKTIGSVSIPLSSTLRTHIGGYYKSFDGFYTSAIDGGKVDFQKDYGFTGTIEWAPTDAFTATLRGTYYNNDDGQQAGNVQPTNVGLLAPSFGYPVPRFAIYQGRVAPIPRNGVNVNTTGINLVPGQTVGGVTAQFPAITFYGDKEEAFRTSLTMAYDFGDVIGTSITSYSDRQADYNIDGDNNICETANSCVPFPFAFRFLPVGTSQIANSSTYGTTRDWSQELRFQSDGASKIDWLFGLFYYHNNDNSIDRTLSAINHTTANTYGYPRSILKTDSFSVFGSVGYKLTDALSITGELRYEYEKKNFEQSPTNPVGTSPLFDLSADYRFVTPRVTIDYKVGEGDLVYATYSRGAKTGGFNTGNSVFVNQRSYDPEYTDNYEIGLKTTSMGGDLRFNVAGYYTNWTDQQIPCQNPISAGGSSTQRTYICNEGASKIYGAELDLAYRLNDYFSINASYAYTHARYDKFRDDSLASALASIGRTQIDFDGRSLPYVPEHKAAVSPTFTLPFTDGMFQARADVSYQSKTYARADNFVIFGDRTVVDLRLRGEYKNFSLQLFANNVFDDDTPVAGVRFFDAVRYSGPAPLIFGPPRRQLGATVGYKF